MARTILIIDDHADSRDALALYLSSCGILVAVAARREDALAILSRPGEIACILMDYHMPGMNAPEFVARLRLDHPKIKCILMSASVDVREIAAKLELKDWISKPIDLERLMALVGNLGHCAA